MKKITCYLIVLLWLCSNVLATSAKVESVAKIKEIGIISSNVVYHNNSLFFVNEEGLCKFDFNKKKKILVYNNKLREYSYLNIDGKQKKRYNVKFDFSRLKAPYLSIGAKGKTVFFSAVINDDKGFIERGLYKFDLSNNNISQLIIGKQEKVKLRKYNYSYEINKFPWSYYKVLSTNDNNLIIFERRNIDTAKSFVCAYNIKKKKERIFYNRDAESLSNPYIICNKSNCKLNFTAYLSEGKYALALTNLKDSEVKLDTRFIESGLWDAEDDLLYGFSQNNIYLMDLKSGKANLLINFLSHKHLFDDSSRIPFLIKHLERGINNQLFFVCDKGEVYEIRIIK